MRRLGRGPALFGPFGLIDPTLLAFSAMKIPWGRLVSSISVVSFLSCSVFVGTPMLGHEHCHNLPTVEGCQETAASLIKDPCLLACIINQCRKAEPHCNATAVADCSRLSLKHPEGKTGGYVPPGPQTCERPGEEIYWCQLDQSPRCQEQSMVHELAHMCGWHHGDGQGVPGDEAGEGRFRCR